MKYHYLAEILAIIETELTRLTQFSKSDELNPEVKKFIRANIKDKKELKKVVSEAMKNY